jgi:hypothetical protein
VLVGHANPYIGKGLEIPQPLRGGVLGDHVIATVELGEPDLNLTRESALAAASGEIKILLAAGATAL